MGNDKMVGVKGGEKGKVVKEGHYGGKRGGGGKLWDSTWH